MKLKPGDITFRLVFFTMLVVLLVAPAIAATTQIHIIKYASDGTTILSETTKTFQELEASLPVLGDGTTHYFHQGPVFLDDAMDESHEQELRWNPEEDLNIQDQGAVKGTNLKDICDLVGGMNSGETVKLRASDGFSKTFAFENVYTYPSRQGPMVISWYWNGNYVDGAFSNGMKLIFFADDFVMGNYDWHESAASQYWYYYQEGSEKYPTTTGLSVKYISEILIYSDDPVPPETGSIAVTSVPDGAEIFINSADTGFTTPHTFTDKVVGSYDVYVTREGYVTPEAQTKSVSKDTTTSFSFTLIPIPPETGNIAVTSVPDGAEIFINSADTGFTTPHTFTDKVVGSYDVYVTREGYVTPEAQTKSVSKDTTTSFSFTLSPIPPEIDIIYDGPVTLNRGDTFTVQAYNNVSGIYIVSRTTPLGALDTVASQQGFTYNASDKRWQYDQILLLDDLSHYLRKSPGYWYAYVNGVYKDGYENPANGLNVLELADNDQVNFYYSTGNNLTAQTDALAAVKIMVDIQEPGPVVNVLYDGTVTLTPDTTFSVVPYNNLTASYAVSVTTPLGALNSASSSGGFTVDVTDKKFSTTGILMVDNIAEYLYSKTAGTTWICQVNGVTLDDYTYPATDGLNLRQLADGDQVNFYYGTKPVTPETATAVVKIKVNTGDQPTIPDWTLTLKGAEETSVTKTFFEQGLACANSGHQTFWTDADQNVWGGVPLWVLVGMVDDSPDVGPDHFNFNDSIAAKGYSVKVNSGDNWNTTLASTDIARNNNYIVVNTFNGQPLPYLTDSGKRSWPLHLKGEAVFGGQQVGNITSIELTGMPELSTGWTLTLEGDVTEVMTQSYFEQAVACHHNVTWTDGNGVVWEGVPLWDLAGAVDDIETSSHYTFNETRAAANYTIRVSATDFSADFYSTLAAHNDGYFVAYKKNGAPLTDPEAPLKLVGPATISGKQRVGNITTITLIGLPDQYPAGNWQLMLDGRISDIIPQGEFEYWAAHHSATYTDANNNIYTGIPLWRLMGWVDDTIPHGSNGFNDAAATAGYTVIVKAGDGYAKEFSSKDIGKNNNYIVANTLNGAPLPTDGDHPPFPLRLVGSSVTGGNSVGNIVEIQLTDFQVPVEAPQLHIVKYAADRMTVISEEIVDYHYMEEDLPVIGDGVTHYKYQGLTLDPADLWDPTETKGMNPPKIDNAIKGTKVRDLVELVGGMGTGTDIVFVASDGWETILGYSNIYTNPYVQSHQGDAVIAWYADGQYVPKYADGMRLFFTPDDHVFGQWNMHEALDEKYWHYNWQGGIQYPSAAGTSAKYITEIRVYSSSEADWELELDGSRIGGISTSISKTYLEQALACTFGSNHKATYTDAQGRVWEGMPLWFFAGFVDDADQHSENAFNQTLAETGYNIVITGSDGYTTTVSSRDIIRSSNYLVANSLDGTHIADGDENWPLRFTGLNVPGSMTVKGVTSIELVPAGSLEVTSSPAGARIFLDGVDTSHVTPYTLTNVPAGEHTVFVTSTGYFTPSTVNIVVIPGQTRSADFILTPIGTGSIKVTSSPAGATIFLDGVNTGRVTPDTLPAVPVGDHEVYATWSGDLTSNAETVEIELGDEVNVHFSLKHDTLNYGSIKVTSSPAGATIFLDGVNTGRVTPDTLPGVPVGNHEVYVTLGGFTTPVEMTVNVMSKANIHFNLKNKPHIILE